MSRPTTLRTRITLVVVGVAAAAVAFTGLITIPLVRTAAVTEARQRVASQVGIVAVTGAPAVEAVGTEATQGTVFALVRGGRAFGQARSYFDASVGGSLAAQGSFSGTLDGDRGEALVEARMVNERLSVLGALPLQAVQSAQAVATRRVLIALALGMFVATIAGWLLARWLARPLHETARSAGRLASGERGVTMPSGGSAETREVVDALESLDRELGTSERRQREFLLSISHETRTPLAAIRGYGEALADGLVASEDTVRVGRTLVAETKRLDGFVADLLALARLEADDFLLEPADVDFAAVGAETVGAWQGRAATLGVQLVGPSWGAVVTGRADPYRLRQVLDGLVENALRATPTGGRVGLGVGAGPTGTVILEVSDSGSGLSDEDLAVVFERGALHARYRESRPVGTGLGLSIAVRLVSRMGGTIRARRAEPTGMVFTVALPVHGAG